MLKKFLTVSPLGRWANACLPPVIWAGVIFVFSSQQVLPGPDVFVLDFLLKKVAHIVVYAVLYWLLWRGVNLVTASQAVKRQLWLPLLIALIYATTDELHQSLVPGRQATLRDIGYDLVGIGTSFLYRYGYI